MKRILLIARAKSNKAKQKANDFAERIQSTIPEYKIENCEISELAFEISPDLMRIYHPKKNFELSEFDLVIIRHIVNYAVEAQAIASYCEYHKIKYTDTYLNRPLLDNKMSTSFMMWVQGVKETPHTLYGPKDELIARFDEFGPKAILKDNNGSKGRLNFVVKNGSEISKIIDENPDKFFVLQKMIPNNGDLRVLVFNGQIKMVISRYSEGKSHLNNTSQGGHAEILDLDSVSNEIKEMSIKAAKVCKLEVAGVDVVKSLESGKYYIFEVNNAPQISSGSFQDEKLIVYSEMIKELLNDK